MITIAVVNRKGGVGKTTTVLNLSYALAQKGKRVLAIDFDPQASLTNILGYDPEELDAGIDGPILGDIVGGQKTSIKDVIQKTDLGFDLAPARDQLELANIYLTSKIGRELILRKRLGDISDDYDFVVIDTQTSISLLTINALAACNYVIIPVELAFLSMLGFNILMNIIEEVKQNVNRDLKILGVIPTKYDKRLKTVNNAMQVLESLKENYKVFPSIKRTVAFDRATEAGKPVGLMDGSPAKEAAEAYAAVAEEVCRMVVV